jgi:AbrB family looped-hinge helix DNA binding protein
MAEATLSSKNQIVIPREAREELGVKPGDKLLVVAKDGKVLIMRRPKSFAKAIKGIAKGLYPQGYIEQERKSWD